LVAVYGNEGLELVSREVAAGILARFTADPTTLAELIVEADASEFRLATTACPARDGSRNAPPLDRREVVDIEILAKDHPRNSARRRASSIAPSVARVALIALWRLRRDDVAWRRLRL
jgi:hypothetical protein